MTINCYGYFYTFLHHEKSKWLLIIHEKKLFWTHGNFLKENQLKENYVTNKKENGF